MEPSVFLALAIWCGVALTGEHFAVRELEAALRDLPDICGSSFKVSPYLRAAVAFQARGRDRAHQRLLDFADTEGGEKAIVLCRLLFVPKPGLEFRRPNVGAAGCLGGTALDDWPLN